MKLILRGTLALLALALTVAAVLGFFFFRAWGKDARPELVSAEWEEAEVPLGGQAVLSMKIQAPWHREIEGARPSRHPAWLLPAAGGGEIDRGGLSFSGNRVWKLRLPLVATGLDSAEGLSLSIPIQPTRRQSPGAVTVPLPALTVQAPELADGLVDQAEPFEFTRAEPATEEEGAKAPKKSRFWLWVLWGLGLLASLWFLITRLLGRSRTVAPWERAQAELDALQRSGEIDQPTFFSRLTDILKRYTSDRFEISADAETSTELMDSLSGLEGVPEGMEDVVRIADRVKFASHDVDPDISKDALTLVRNFVVETTPVGEEDDAEEAEESPSGNKEEEEIAA